MKFVPNGGGHDLRKAIDIILDHLERHGDSLWGHVVNLPIHAGGGIRVINRTNNCLEFKFSGIKRGERRRSGRKVLTQDMENLPPDAMLVSNLDHPDYVEIVCGSLDGLPEAFAELDMKESTSILGKKGSLVIRVGIIGLKITQRVRTLPHQDISAEINV